MPVYLLLYIGLFWVPIGILSLWMWGTLDPSARRAFWWAIFIMAGLTTVMEYVFMAFHIWSFSQKIDPLLGLWIAGVPIEEFVFWFGAPPLFLLIYLAMDRLFPCAENGHAYSRRTDY